MNLSVTYHDLPQSQRILADGLASGLELKEIACKVNRSYHTLDTQRRTLYLKAEVSKATEFVAWYFITRFNLSFSITPVRRAIIGLFFLVLFCTSINETQFVRLRTSRGVEFRSSRRNDNDFES